MYLEKAKTTNNLGAEGVLFNDSNYSSIVALTCKNLVSGI
jgi:hypothetical protein